MIDNARRLVVALALALSGVVLAQAPAHACTCKSASVRQDADRADAVFSGVLVERNRGTTGKRDLTELRYRVSVRTVYKGDVSTRTVRITSRSDLCGLGRLEVDRTYLWFVTRSGGGLTTDRCSGTAEAGDGLTAKVVEALGEGTPVGGPGDARTEPADFTPVAGGEPPTLTRLAAPGAALVLVGLLGLLVVRRRTSSD